MDNVDKLPLRRLAVPSINSICPAISVVIPLYNAEKYIAECLESLLNQTFQNFEVIVVDDCSTDSSVAIVESYAPKFDGWLTLLKMEKNTGSGAMPRNKGLMLSRGEYIYTMDNDDRLMKTALEELYTLAKKYDADVVYCEKYYMSTGAGEEFLKNIYPAVKKIQRPPYVSKPTFIPDNLSKRFKELMDKRFWPAPWSKLVRREVIIKNELFFPALKISDDDIWTIGLIFYAKRFLRVPNAVYIRRMRETSITGIKKTPQQTVNFWLNSILLGLKSLDNLMSKHEFFQKNLSARYDILKYFVASKFNLTLISAQELTEYEIYRSIKDEFGEKLGDYDVLIPALCTAIYNEKKAHENDIQVFNNFALYFTARINIRLIPESGGGDFQILSLSDDKAKVTKPSFINRDGIDYKINSYVGKLEFVVKATVDGKIRLFLRGSNVRDPNNKAKQIYYWIDYTALVVNGQTILDKLTTTGHGKFYNYNMEVKADEEITFQVEWLPHRSKT